MKKILILTHEFAPFRGGIASYIEHLGRAAAGLGHELTVVAPDYGKRLIDGDRDNFPFEVVRFRGGEYRLTKILSLLHRTRKWAYRRDYDIIHAADWPHIMALAYLNRKRLLKFTATIYGTEVLLVPGSRQVRWLGVPDLFEKPKQIFAISDFSRRLLLERFPNVAPERVQVTLLGVGDELFQTPDSEIDIRAEYDIPDEHKIVLTVARLDERKGHRRVIEALKSMPDEIKNNTSYLIVGAGVHGYTEQLKAAAASGGIRMTLAGTVTNSRLRAIYRAADIFCMPGEMQPRKIEGFGLVYLEAAAQGTPSIATRLGGVPEVIAHENTGLLTDPGDDKALAAALKRLLTDNDDRRRLGEAAREKARSFTWERCARQTYGS